MNNPVLLSQLQRPNLTFIGLPSSDVFHDARDCDNVARAGRVAEVFRDLHLDRPGDLPGLVLGELLHADVLPVDRDGQRVVAQEGEAPRLAALHKRFGETL